MKRNIILIGLATTLLAVALIAIGCAQIQEPERKEEIPIGGTTAQTEEETTIRILTAPSNAKLGEQVMITWKVEGEQKKASHTAIHYDYKTHAGNYGKDISAEKSGYPKLTQNYASGNYDIPGTFSDTITLDKEGVLYYRTHILIEGKNYWTPEKSILVRPKEEPIQRIMEPVDKNYFIEANDLGYFMAGNKINSISVNQDTKLGITFNVSKDNVYYGGLDFKGCGVNSSAKPGESTTLVLTAERSCSITSFWPSSGNEKSSLEIKVATRNTGGGY